MLGPLWPLHTMTKCIWLIDLRNSAIGLSRKMTWGTPRYHSILESLFLFPASGSDVSKSVGNSVQISEGASISFIHSTNTVEILHIFLYQHYTMCCPWEILFIFGTHDYYKERVFYCIYNEFWLCVELFRTKAFDKNLVQTDFFSTFYFSEIRNSIL